MENLKSFLRENIENENTYDVVISDRFLDEDGNIIKWKLKTVPTIVDEFIRNSCQKNNEEFDFNKYLGKLTSTCVVYPNLKNAQLQDSYNVKTEDDLLKSMLLAGEYANLVSNVQKINGFDKTFDELVEISKN